MEIELFGQLAKERESIHVETFPQPMTVLELAEKLDLALDLVGLISIDGKSSHWSDKVNNENRVCFFPYLEGG